MKVIALLAIVLGAVLLWISDGSAASGVYLKITGFALLMYGLYRSTVLWVKDNPRNDGDNDDSFKHNGTTNLN